MKQFQVDCVAHLQSMPMSCTVFAESEEEAYEMVTNMASDFFNKNRLLDDLTDYGVYLEDIEEIEISQVGD